MKNENKKTQTAFKLWLGFSWDSTPFREVQISSIEVDKFSGANSVVIDGRLRRTKSKEEIICRTFEDAQRKALMIMENHQKRLQSALDLAEKNLARNAFLSEELLLEQEAQERQQIKDAVLAEEKQSEDEDAAAAWLSMSQPELLAI